MASTYKLVLIVLLLMYYDKVASEEDKDGNSDYSRNTNRTFGGSSEFKKGANKKANSNFKTKVMHKRPSSNTSKSNSSESLEYYFAEGIRTRRYAQKAGGKIADLRKRVEAEKKKEQMLNDPRLEPKHPGNETAHVLSDSRFGGINTQQHNQQDISTDKMRQLMTTNKKETSSHVASEIECNFESPCSWTWKTDIANGFKVSTAGELLNATDPDSDADGNKTGHFLFVRPTSNLQLSSPLFNATLESCNIELSIYQDFMENGEIKLVIEAQNKTHWVADRIYGDNSKKWTVYKRAVGKVSGKFHLILEILLPNSSSKSVIAVDNIKMTNCYTEDTKNCTSMQYICSETLKCLNKSKVCDITRDCKNGDDETQNCDKMPYGAKCDFEQDLCGWHNVEHDILKWIPHNGSTPTNGTGPDFDHTYKNSTGKYLYVNMATINTGFGSTAGLKSVIFNPPPRVHGNISSPYYNSCMVRFYLHSHGAHKSGLMLHVTELGPSDNYTTDILWVYYDHGNDWIPEVVSLPNITHRYYLHFEAKKGIRYIGDIAIDDVSLSPECFGLNIPIKDLNGYSYDNPHMGRKPHKDFASQTYYEISTCGAKGRYGPTERACSAAYNNTKTEITVMNDPQLRGVQRWTVPSENIYTFILFGASGGKGSGGTGSSRGAMVRVVMDLPKGKELYFLVGQEGSSACLKSLGQRYHNTSCIPQKDKKNITGVRGVLNMVLEDGGGGGGGGTFLFTRTRGKMLVPLAVAAGGGGLSVGQYVDTGVQHGQAINMSKPPVTGHMYGLKTAGAGGGWRMFQGEVTVHQKNVMGQALLMGGIGGKACYNSTDGRGDGGFGGGGGGCIGGGGGGGYAGGSVHNSTNGEGGYSFLDPSRTIPSYSEAHSGYNAGPGSVLILPAVPGCECDYLCLALDAKRSQVSCICPKDWNLDSDQKKCIVPLSKTDHPTWLVMLLIATVICLTIAFAVVCFFLYNRYQQRKTGLLQRKMLSGHELQLNRLRIASDSMMTEYNPSYEFGGVVYTLKDLKDIPRDQLRLVKALGQGAFGEVYQGFYRQRSGDTVEMPVAVKTLPEMSTNQAEMDFLMEALIMSKFRHPNIVHFIGVCFDKHPRFIVLELLAGGDLKNFLRESRPKPERGTSLTMKDLVLIAIDVAKGCRYLEENRFIHRDIAARNCLLTTKGPGRVVKIADFGMSRDVYRSDYYRKGGKAMLPIKWMPPEAFLDGIFTSKTDVWSFGVLLWEIMSMGYMPYTGCANREVMQLVTSGGRLEPPANCPGPIYGIMTQCWHPAPEQRPSFALILERLDYCSQDPEVMSAPLPVFNRPLSQERDTTLMRPNSSDDTCLQVPQTTDYLIPNHTNFSVMPNSIGSTSSVDKLLPENSDSWETSFVMPHSRSTQPLLPDTEHNIPEGGASNEKLLGADANQNPKAKVSPVSLPNNIVNNHNNNVKQEGLKSGLSLDAGALAKQTMAPVQKKPYANLNAVDNLTGNGVLPNGPYTIQNQNTYMNNAHPNKYVNEPEIGC